MAKTAKYLQVEGIITHENGTVTLVLKDGRALDIRRHGIYSVVNPGLFLNQGKEPSHQITAAEVNEKVGSSKGGVAF